MCAQKSPYQFNMLVRTSAGMLREQINDIMVRWNPKERRGSTYDPGSFIETPEQARRLISHLRQQLEKARMNKNTELVNDINKILLKVENLAQRFFRWEANNQRTLQLQEMREIKKLPVRF